MREPDGRADHVAAVLLHQQPAFGDMRLVESLAEVEDGGKGDILVREPFA